MKRFMFQSFVDYMNSIKKSEVWKAVTLDGVKSDMYEVSNIGNIRNKHNQQLIKIRIYRGYVTVQLMSDIGKSRTFRAHRLVAHEFVDGFHEGLVVNHKDGNKLNNNSSNLEWITQKENIRHANVTGLVNHAFGERVNTTKLTKEIVDVICNYLIKNNGSIINTFNSLSKRYPCINYSMIQDIRNKDSWKCISDKYFTKETFLSEYNLSSDDIEKICKTLIMKDINGDINKTIDLLKPQIPCINHDLVYRIKSKHGYNKISDKYFDKSRFRQRLLPEDAEQISYYLKKYSGNINSVLNELSDNPRINKTRIIDIRNKDSHQEISDKYFKKNEFNKL